MTIGKPSKLEKSHSTAREVIFLDAILTDKNVGYPRKTDRKIRTLQGYIAGAKKRASWDLMDKVLIISHAEEVLKKLVSQSIIV